MALFVPLIDPFAVHFDTFAGDVYTLDTASITLTAGTLTATTLAATGLTAKHVVFVSDDGETLIGSVNLTYNSTTDTLTAPVLSDGSGSTLESGVLTANSGVFATMLNLGAFGPGFVGSQFEPASLTVNPDSDYTIAHTVSNRDLIFGINDGGVNKTITWDSSENTLLFDDDTALNMGSGALTTTGDISCDEITATINAVGKGGTFGDAFVGTWGFALGSAVFSHKNFASGGTAYAVLQTSAGQVAFNAAAGQGFGFLIGANIKMRLGSNGNFRIINSLKIGADTDPAANLDVLGDSIFGQSGGNQTLIGATGNITQAGSAITTLDQLYLNEITTPTPIANDGAIYTKSNKELFFQDGAGVEHLLHGDAFSNLWFHSANVDAIGIGTAALFTLIDSFENIGEQDDLGNVVANTTNNDFTIGTNGAGKYKLTFHVSVSSASASSEMVLALGITLNTVIDVTGATNATPIVVTSVAHGLMNGDMVTIVGATGNTGANGDWVVTAKTDDTFTLVDLTGSNSAGNGVYDASSGDVTIKYPGNTVIHREVGFGALGVGGANADTNLATSDKVKLYVANVSSTRDLLVAIVNMEIARIGD